jgi:RNase P/RNase MRP subunit p30
MIDTENIDNARKEIDKLHREKKKVIVLGKDIEFNRKILENKKVNVLLINHKGKKDKLRQRDSGLNQVLCKIARDNKIKIGFDFSELESISGKERALILSRLIQNVRLCRKYKTDFLLISNKKDKNSLFSLLLTLGCDTKTAKKSLN